MARRLQSLPPMWKRTMAVVAICALGVRADASSLTLVAGDREPAQTDKPDDAAIQTLRDKVTAEPKDREARFALVRALMKANRMSDALAAAKAWRAIDAYNLVVVRVIGDIYSELGKRAEARRAYSAVVELLPKDATAQRALASVRRGSRRSSATTRRRPP
jgi:cytochrome c-type biogenesis protein CcmH/NrfG